jgi:hypothetical protein
MSVFAPERIGKTRRKTPEGFLFCEGCIIARTGTQLYGPYEIPVPVGNDGRIRVERPADEVFRKETVDSFAGKSVVVSHPEEDVSPDNWRELTVGVVLDPRRGEGEQADYLVADLLITDAEAIRLIEDGELSELSCGYDAKYEVIEAGHATQRNIVGNHVALVLQARCGSTCSIGDGITHDCCNEEEIGMTWKEKLLKAIKGENKDAAIALLEEVPETGKTETHVHVHTRDEEEGKESEWEEHEEKEKKTHDAIRDAVADAVKPIKDGLDALDARMAKVEDAIGDEDKEEEEDEEEGEKEEEKYEKTKDELPGLNKVAVLKLKDSKAFEKSFQETVALAEVIQPGVKIPTFDAAAAPGKTVDVICQFRRRTLDRAYDEQSEVKEFMDGVLAGRDFKTYDCGGVRTVFQAVGAFKKKANNGPQTSDSYGAKPLGKVASLAELNAKNREFYKEAR